jgi:Fe-S oxidoreductase
MEKYRKILDQEGIDYIMLKDKELCCGSPLKNAGAEKEYKELARKNMAVMKAHGVDRIITNCPACAVVLKQEYREMLGAEWNIEVQHFTEIITKVSKVKESETVTYHDPCHLGRGMGVYEQPRAIIKKTGHQLKEMQLCKNKSFCCGGGGGVKSNHPELANRIAKDRIEHAKITGAKMLITPCPMCYANLKENSDGMEVKEMSDLLI